MKNNHIPIENARITGSFFLFAFVAYGLGRHLFESQDTISQYSGSALIMLNSVLVIFIGILFRKTLIHYNVWVANIYLIARIIEGVALSALVVNLVSPVKTGEDTGYFLGMICLGLGSLPMTWILYKYRIAPAWLALWGIIGYAVFALGFVMEFLGKPWSMYLLGPGGLWEVLFALWLIFRKTIHSR